jgi:hypothetical protein
MGDELGTQEPDENGSEIPDSDPDGSGDGRAKTSEKKSSESKSKEKHGGYSYIHVYRPGMKYLTWLPITSSYYEMEGFFKRSGYPELTFKVVKGSSVTYYTMTLVNGKVKTYRTGEKNEPANGAVDLGTGIIGLDPGSVNVPANPTNPVFTPPELSGWDDNSGSADNPSDDQEDWDWDDTPVVLLR